MALFDIAARLPFFKKETQLEYFFSLSIGTEILSAALWTIDNHKLKIVNSASSKYSREEEIVPATDRLLDQVLGPGESPLEPDKILFSVPDSWLQDDNLKEDYLKLLRSLVKELELKPLAYVSSAHALSHYLEKKENSPVTAILVEVGEKIINVVLTRAGKVEGSKVIKREDNIGTDIEKALLSFVNVEVLPSKILIFSSQEQQANLEKIKAELLSFSWMSKLSFLHFPKVDILEPNLLLLATSLAGATEIDSEVKVVLDTPIEAIRGGTKVLPEQPEEIEEKINELTPKEEEDTGFIAGDVTEKKATEEEIPAEIEEEPRELEVPHQSQALNPTGEFALEEDYQPSVETGSHPPSILSRFRVKKGFPLIIGVVVVLLLLAYILLPQAVVSIYVEPRILEKDMQVIADPTIKSIDEAGKRIPGQIVQTEISGSEKGVATGKKEIGDPAKGTVLIYNKTNEPKTFSKGTVLTAGGLKFTLDASVSATSSAAVTGGIAFGKATAGVTASSVGPDSNISSGTELTVGNFSKDQVVATSEGNFSGGTSKEVTVVTDADQKKLLASLASNLRKKAQEELQSKNADKKVLEEALTEEITKKSYSKNINDAASEFSLTLTARYKGTAYNESDLKTMVSKLVETNVPSDFMLNLAETETQADVSKVEKDGKVIFLARFRAKLIPKIDTSEIKKKIRGKTPNQVADILRGYDNILGSQIKLTPSLPSPFGRLPILDRNIKIEVGLK